MNIIKIVRDSSKSHDKGTFGKIWFNDEFIGYTVERPWKDNEPKKSCVPVGEYDCEVHNSLKFGKVVALTNPSLQVFHWPHSVAANGGVGRAAILIHVANFVSEIEGCIAPGLGEYIVKGEVVGVSKSRAAVQRLQELWGDRSNLKVVIENS